MWEEIMSRAVLVLAQKFRSALERTKASEPHIYLTLRENFRTVLVVMHRCCWQNF